MHTLENKDFDTIIEALVSKGYIILEEVLPQELVNELHQRISSLTNLNEAKIGRGNERQKVSSIRSDKTLWLEGEDASEEAYLEWMENLRQEVNQALYLGLFEYEAHFAQYEKGAFYQKHLDVLKGNNPRVLTTVFYLNKQWQEGDGGELLIYDEAGEEVLEKVSPTLGKMVIFLSDKFAHEVLPAHTRRYSIAGWFKKSA